MTGLILILSYNNQEGFAQNIITDKVKKLAITNYANQKLEVQNFSILKIGYENYALKYRICTDNQTVPEPKFFVVTDKEYYLAKGDKTLKENTCEFVFVFAIANNAEKTFVIPFDGNYVPSNYLAIKPYY